MRFTNHLAFAAILLLGCSNGEKPPADAGPPDSGIKNPCSLPGSVQFTASGKNVVPGGGDGPSLDWLSLPVGFCAHYYGNVGNARQLRFAPGGELFVASPTTGTTGGGQNGQSAIVVLPDDNHDGLADSPITFLSGLPSTQGMMFTKDHFYYQDAVRILRIPYKAGDRAPTDTGEEVANISYYSSGLHWPKAMDVTDDGTIYVGNGGDQGELCVEPHPVHGAVLALDGSSNGKPIAQGLRNPIAVRCSRGHNRCFALELAKDYTASEGGREKMILIHEGDDWGFPCCATKDLPYKDTFAAGKTPDCSKVVAEDNAFLIGDTPFGLDFEGGFWPGQWNGRAYVANHGAAGTWTGARIVAIPMDAATGLPKPSSNTSGSNTGMDDFATGWDDGTLQHGRPAAVAFSPDGRLFVASDTTGMIFWIAAM
jgi:glucose/arabinose dehydrogenase